MEKLIKKFIEDGVLKTPEIISAFRKIQRKDFIPENLQYAQSVDSPLPIGDGQTISQPYTVAFMLELLEPKKGQKILDVGSGSGWVSTLLAEIVGLKGFVYAIERITQLLKFGENNAIKYKLPNIKIRKCH